MSKLSENFHRAEFACQDGCGFDTVDAELVDVLQTVRRVFKSPVTITSGCRCPEHNAAVGGAPNSQHVLGRAADIVVEDAAPLEVYRFLAARYGNRFGFGLYERWIHVDTRTDGPARWHA